MVGMGDLTNRYDLPVGCKTERIVQDIGNFTGAFPESDTRNFDGNWRAYRRIRMAIDVRKLTRG